MEPLVEPCKPDGLIVTVRVEGVVLLLLAVALSHVAEDEIPNTVLPPFAAVTFTVPLVVVVFRFRVLGVRVNVPVLLLLPLTSTATGTVTEVVMLLDDPVGVTVRVALLNPFANWVGSIVT
jgi:hypothetical protein